MMKWKKKYIVVFIFVSLFSIFFTQDKVYAAPSGGYKLVNFKTKPSSLLNTSYTEETTGNEGYTNGYYGADAVYLGMSGNNVKFKLSGVIGYVNKDEVELFSMNDQASYDKYYTSFYKVVDGVIQHKITTNILSVSGYNTVPLGLNTVGLETGKDYLSYDGHYFYPATLTGYQQMTDDYMSGSYSRAVNAGRPYYNYYQYVSHRTKTNYTAKDIENMIKNMGFTSKVNDPYDLKSYESLLYGEQNSFISGQNMYGANAMMIYSLAIHESSKGRSSIALRTNNLFGHGAYDSAPGASANGYESVTAGILAHAQHFVSIDYMDPKDYLDRYKGGHFGNKSSGFNVKYASDPYWGEKAAYQYYQADKPYGFQDYGAYTLGIKTSNKEYTIYKDPDTSSTPLYTTGKVTDYPVVILWELTGSSINGNNKWYKIQTDPVLNSSRTAFVQDIGEYNYDNNYAYIHSSAIDVLIKGGTASVNATYNITFNANGGVYSDKTGSKTVNVQSGTTPQVENPTREGYNFVGWNETVSPATKDKTYTAKWQIKEYSVTFDANGGTFTDGLKTHVVKTKYQQTPSIDEPAREGYVFTGWSPEVVMTTKDVTYKATWKESISYEITFNADGGVFSNGKDTFVTKVASGTIPKVETPIKEGYVFIGWTPKLEEVTKEASYEAIWKKGTIEDVRTEKNGIFYFNSLQTVNKKFILQGYQTISGMDNNLKNDIQYMIVYKNVETGEEVRTFASRITNSKDIPKQVYSPDGHDYTYSWFNAELDIDTLPVGNYQMYVIAYTEEFYAKSLISNKGYKTQETNYAGEEKVVVTGNNYDSKNSYVELSVRDEFIVKKTSSYIYNQYDKYTTFEFTPENKLHLRGNVYSYGMNLGKNTSVSRKIVFENKETYKAYVKDLGSITNGSYTVYLPVDDKLSKDRAWYDASIDLSDIPEGEYVIYLTTSSNISDINKMTEKMGRKLDKVTTTIGGKKYTFSINKNSGNRIEMKVEK